MGKLKEFDIIFGNPHRVYKAGETMTGYLILHLDEEMSTHGLHLVFSGKASLLFYKEWYKHKQDRYYVNSERYFQKDVNLYPPDGIPVGHHEFPFTFSLPSHIPSSFDCFIGKVRYSVKAQLKVGWKKTIDVERCFVVFCPLDLNDTGAARNAGRPIENKGEVSVRGSMGKITALIRLQRRGFVPGETIPVRAAVKNRTGLPITKVFFTFEQTYEGHVHGKTETETRKLKSATPPAGDKGVPARSSAVWDALDVMTVPVTPPSRLDGCQFLDISYHLVLNLVWAGVFTYKNVVKVDILIGTEPLANHEHNVDLETAPLNFDSAYFNNDGYLTSPERLGDEDMADTTEPPSYSAYTASQESMQDSGTGDHTNFEMRDTFQQPPPPAYDAIQGPINHTAAYDNAESNVNSQLSNAVSHA
ncbi:arrestin domain-containing protein 17-like [Littorina saxatilis]|uniref:Arrestin C-terminal-like domain-containing protein n=1 Tax=Littorina saxatilis TaxID=31220 RepID=A0AAN9C311_9CAEN